MMGESGILSRRHSRLRWFARLLVAGVAVVSVLVLIGWMLEVELLKRIVPGVVAMNPATAILFLLSGGALWLKMLPAAKRRWDRLANGAAAAIVTVGLIRLAGYWYDIDVFLDQILFREGFDEAIDGPNRMAPNTAFCFVLTGLALLVLDREIRGGRRLSEYLAFTWGLFTLLAVLGYAYGASGFYGIAAYIPMALNTAWCFLGMATAVLMSRPERGLMAVMTSESAGGILARRLFPAVLLLPPILGYLHDSGADAADRRDRDVVAPRRSSSATGGGGAA
jgi:hypothetical protein